MPNRTKEQNIKIINFINNLLKVLTLNPIIRIDETNKLPSSYIYTSISCSTNTRIRFMYNLDTTIFLSEPITYLSRRIFTSIIN